MESEEGSKEPSFRGQRKEKRWSDEQQKEFWRRKKEERRRRKKIAAEERRMMQQQEWESLTDEERERRRMEAITVHERRRLSEALLDQKCHTNLADSGIPILVFDLSFSWCMNLTDCRSTLSQIKLSYSSLRRHGFPFRPVVTSIDGGSDESSKPCEHSDTLRSLCDFSGFRRYPLPVHESHWSALYRREQVVFLTADTDTALERIERDTVYVVGAFVDHNARKYLSRDAAAQYGVRMARLPLVESIEVGNRCKVLTVNHVVDVLCRYADCGDWPTAFDVLPTRRIVSRRQKRLRNLTTACGSLRDGNCNSTDGEQGGGSATSNDGRKCNHKTDSS
ncbi:putative tRNA (Guanine 1) methyltransferase [Trypanosoma vivax]|uniref:tRNA (guanine(9)-N(1))-methyltransferase n=1 Tax=Trypanosoma vivax (strain Y486) TaxID=1055687 RepID=G0TXA1_TRYVY|nr:putative tRNA (Guanine 1) methyltransferase [Trypanosoma vivax]CCC48591.1 conserved hypothetical protein [Trypanosoma vivax Y486]